MKKEILQEIKRVREIMNLNEELLNEEPWLKNLFKYGGEDALTIGKNLSNDTRENLLTALKSGDESAIMAARETLFGHVANQLAAEGVDLKKFLQKTKDGKIKYLFNDQTKSDLAAKIKAAMGVNDDRAVADFLMDYKVKQGAGEAQTAFTDAKTATETGTGDLGGTSQTLATDMINPADVAAWVDAMKLRFGKNIPADILERSAQNLAAQLPGTNLFQKLNYIETQVPELDAVFAKRQAAASLRNKQMYANARVMLGDLGNMLRRLPKNPKQFLGMAFQILSGFAVIGAIAGAIKPEEGHSRLYSAMNGVSLGLLDMFNEPSKGNPSTATTTRTQTTPKTSFDPNADPTKGPDQNATTAGNNVSNTGTQTTNATPTQSKKLTWY